MEQLRAWLDEILVALINLLSKIGLDKALRPEETEETE